MLDLLSAPETWISLATLAALEIVLGIDNIVFISILSAKLPPPQRPLGRRLGLAFALLTRLGLLTTLSWLMGLGETLFTVLGKGFSAKDLILLGGGLFLLGKSTMEIFEGLEVEEDRPRAMRSIGASLPLIVAQIMIMDIVFSLDSVITAVGMAQSLAIMATAMIIAVLVMLLFANAVGEFVTRHPSMKVLALSFLILIGVLLVAESFGHHVPKGYIYFAMAFSLGVELLNMRLRKRGKLAPVELHRPPVPHEEPATSSGSAAL